MFSLLQEGSVVFDFTGTGPQVEGNLNAPRSITLSALIYCLRCMVGHDVPLNQVPIYSTRLQGVMGGAVLLPYHTLCISLLSVINYLCL